MSVDAVEVRTGSYADSVTLMQVSQRAGRADGVEAALVAMATPLNVDLLVGLGFPAPAAGPNDLVVAVRARDDAALAAACAVVETALTERAPASGPADTQPPRTTASAARHDDAGVVLVSVPGEHAVPEAVDAIEAGRDVLIFSDNVPIAAEIALKDAAARAGVLVMGPDCGTAVVDGVGLGFANAVRPGRVGIVAASGTGAQQVSCLLDEAGVGISALYGVGGRDLSAAVGGRSTRAALARLADDSDTDTILVLSKPPADEVADALRAAGAALAKPVHFALLGAGQPDLTAAVEALVGPGEWPVWGTARPARGGVLRGLFTGGTLCDEAMLIASATLGPVASNIPLRPEWALPADLRADGHLCIDFGDDALTRGRAHPMIDPTLRTDRLAAELADPAVGVVLLDVVLGYGSHPDPAPDLAAVIAASTCPVVVALIGTAADPQDRGRQAGDLAEAGAQVFASNAAAARRAVELVG